MVSAAVFYVQVKSDGIVYSSHGSEYRHQCGILPVDKVASKGMIEERNRGFVVPKGVLV